MDTSLWSAGYGTHLRIVAVSLIASIVVVFVGLNARLDRDITITRDGPANAVVKAGASKHYTETGQPNIR